MADDLFDGLALGSPPAKGFSADRHRLRLSADPAFFPVARDAVLTWQVQRRSGIRVLDAAGSDAPPAHERQAARLRVPLVAGIRLSAPVRVLRVIDRADVAGFVYRAEPGHPERGEEAFLVRLTPSGEVVIEIAVVSRPRMPFALAAPIGRRMQRRFTARYLAALEPGRAPR